MTGRFFMALVAVIVIGLGVGAGASAVQSRTTGSGEGATTANRQQSSQGAQSQNSGNGQRGGFGTVANASASGFTLSGPGGDVKVSTSKDTKVTKEADAKVSDLKVGDAVVVMGSQQADGSIQATSVQAGSANQGSGMLGQFGQGNQNGSNGRGQGNGSGGSQGNQNGSGNRSQGSPSGGTQGAQGARGPAAAGTIESIDGGTITIQTQSGSTKVTTSASTTVRKAVDGSLSDIQNGQTAVVSGSRGSDGTITATSIQLTPAGATSSGS